MHHSVGECWEWGMLWMCGSGSIRNFWTPPTQFCCDSKLSSVQSLNHVWLFANPWTAARQASLSITNSQSLTKPMSIESVMPTNHLILCHPLLLTSVFPSIFSNESALRIRWPEYFMRKEWEGCYTLYTKGYLRRNFQNKGMNFWNKRFCWGSNVTKQTTTG